MHTYIEGGMMDCQFLSTSPKHSRSTPTLMLEPDSTSPHANGGASLKWSKAPPIPGGQTSFRLLCHSSRIGGVIGKSGSIIKHLQQSTSSKIKVEDSNSPPTSDDRVITIVASNSLNKNITFSHSTDEVQVSSAQEALLRVFERILEVAAETDEGLSLSLDSGSLVSCRMIVEKTQAGSVIGKGGKVVEKIKRETRTKIRVLPLDNKLPSTSGVLLGEEIIEIEGDILAVKKALVAVSRCLQDSPPVDKTRVIISRPHEAVSQEALLTSSVGHPSGGQPLSLETGRVRTMESRTLLSPQQEVVFRILCSSDRVGGVIGKGGTIVRAIQNDTGASIIVGTSVDECDERLITITAVENPESQYSPALNAVVLVFNRSVEAGIENGLDFGSKGSSVSARLVVSSNQVGCLLGKGGAIVSEMRKVTRTGIRITGGNEIAKCVPENDQVVQIVGQFVNVQDALYKVGSRLRENLLPSKMLNGVGTRGSSSLITDPNPYDRARNRHSLGPQSSAVSHGLNRHPTLSQSMERLGLSHDLDHPSPSLRASKKAAGPNPRSSLDVGRESTSVQGGLELGSGNRSAFVTNTTVEIIVREHVIGSVYGENGSNLARLRQISGAKVEVNEARPGTSDRMVVISGSPDETQAAQSLLHAFILTGSS